MTLAAVSARLSPSQHRFNRVRQLAGTLFRLVYTGAELIVDTAKVADGTSRIENDRRRHALDAELVRLLPIFLERPW